VKITKKYLEKIIKEEYGHLISESETSTAINGLFAELAKIPGSDKEAIISGLVQIVGSLEEIKRDIKVLKGKA
jgi:hypothetical protein